MIPLRLQLRNFMCYRDLIPVDFTGIHVACLAGDNGHGKSALLDALTWALWGRARAHHDDELITAGEKGMEVELEFLLGDAHYRVIRKRELGRLSKSALEFQMKDQALSAEKGQAQFRSLTASTQRETQARISQVLHMDYDTFINSALLLQGRADEFTVKQPAERKRILADILGLAIYDEYEQRAKMLAKEKEQAAKEVEARIQEIERELEHRPEYERELEMAQTQLAQLSEQARAAEAELQDLRDRVKILETRRMQLAEVDKRIQAAKAQLEELDRQIKAQDQSIAANESILARRTEIEAGYARWLQVRQQEAECSVKLPQLLALSEDKAGLEKRIAAARNELELQKQVAEHKCAELQKLAEQCEQLKAEHVKVAKALEELAALRDEAEASKQHILALAREASALDTCNKQIKVEMAALKEKVELLQQPTATCPLCGQALTEDHRVRLLAQLEAEGAQKGELFRSNAARCKELNAQIASAQSEAERIERELRRVPALQGREATLSKTLQEAQEAAARLAEQRQAQLILQKRLEQREFAAEEQEQLAAIEARIVKLGYNQAVHEQLRQAMNELANFETEKRQLDRAEQVLLELRINREQLVKNRELWASTLEQDAQRYAELSSELAGLAELTQSLQAKQHETDELRSREGRARQLVGAAQQKLDHCRYLTRERKDRAAQLKKLGRERSLYEELQLAFGKKGLQALIIESAIPEIEDEANQLLSRMTAGRMSVHFDTQRDTKSGSTVETLDIKVADENGPRSYEMYSGGEAFRINFAIRIALSKLLARRAGARLQTLIIDEGFGTQDAEGRQRLVEAIQSIQDDFALLIVITHIEELRDAFPVRIDVVKTARGSQVSIN
jgi:exonuclease SbcC